MSKQLISYYIVKLAHIVIASQYTFEDLAKMLQGLYTFIEKTPDNNFETKTNFKGNFSQSLLIKLENPLLNAFLSNYPAFNTMSKDKALEEDYGNYVSIPYLVGKLLMHLSTILNFKVVMGPNVDIYLKLEQITKQKFNEIWGVATPADGTLITMYSKIQDTIRAKASILPRIEKTIKFISNTLIPKT